MWVAFLAIFGAICKFIYLLTYLLTYLSVADVQTEDNRLQHLQEMTETNRSVYIIIL